MTRVKRLAAVISLAIALTAMIVAVPATALDQTAKPITLSLDKRSDYQEYPRMVAANPSVAAARWANPNMCKTEAYCDVTLFNYSVPEGEITKVVFTISFDHGPEVEGEHTNDIDVFFVAQTLVKTYSRDSAGKESVAETTSYVLVASAATAGQPEVMKLADLPPTTEIRFREPTQAQRNSGVYKITEQSVQYYFQIYLFSGTTDYKIRGELSPITLPEFEEQEFTRVFRRSDSSFGSGSPRAAFGTGADLEMPQEEKVPIVKEPGADGPLSEHDLFLVKDQASERKDKGLTPIIPISIAVVLIGAGTAGFFYLRARRRGVEEA